MLEYAASRVGEAPAAFDEYASSRDATRREHLREIVRSFGLRPFDAQARREIFGFLLPVGMGTDRGPALVEAALGEMRARAVVSPATATVEELCWEARLFSASKQPCAAKYDMRRRYEQRWPGPPYERSAQP